jgi:hypothetical protein
MCIIRRLTHELREDFDTALQGNNLKEADLKTLTGGARIANIFRERFPFELVKVRRKKKFFVQIKIHSDFK